MAKYIDLPNLKENLTNFLNKKINPIYAKKTEIPSNVSELNNDKSYQTAEEVGQAVTDGVARIVAGAPEDFDTLKEMSDWISSHETSAAAMNSAISDNSVAIANHTSNSDIHVTKAEKTKWDNKVDSIEGKTLSNNNFLYKYKDTLDKMPTTYQYKTHYNKEDGTFNMVSINAGSQGTDPQTFQKYTLPSNYKDIFDGVNSKIEDLALNGVYSNKVGIDQVNSNLDTLEFGEVAGGKNLFNPKCLLNATYNEKTSTITVSSNNYKALDMVFKENTKYTFSAYIKQNSSSTNIRLKIIYTDGTLYNALFTQSTSEVYLSETSKSGKTISEVQWDFGNNGTATFRNFQIEEGDIATPYEPYIPSVKTLTADVAKLNSDLSGKMNCTNPTGTGSFSLNRAPGSTIGTNSHSEGSDTESSGGSSHAEGSSTTASGESSHAEGFTTTASGTYSHAEGVLTTASGKCSHSEGYSTTASKNYSHAEGYSTNASGDCSHAEGSDTIASGAYSHAEGGEFTTASGFESHAEGGETTASGESSHAEGACTTASGESSHAEGVYTIASNFASHASGKLNASMTTGGTFDNTTGTAFVIGNGTSEEALSNAFSVQYDGTVKAKSTITASTTADYAEFFEWLDGNPDNEDRVGYFVTLDGNRIKIASDNDDYILGIVSGEPFVLGNGDCDTWNGMYLHDEFRRTIYEPAPKVEEVEIKEEREETYIDEETGEEKIRTVEVVIGHEFKEIEGEFDGTRPKLNPEYDNTQQYVSRFDRKEWSPVGMLGVLAVRHDGTAKVNGYVTVNKDGIATVCDRNIENSYRVIKANADSVVEIIFK